MTEKIGHVKNPLTIIAIFAGLAEIGGTIVLPLLQPSVQAIYVWFLMIFPTALIALFFFVLYHKHEVLYSPSDFQNESTFKELLQVSATARKVASTESFSAEPTKHKSFDQISPIAKKILKTLWKFQKEIFPTLVERWGFSVGPGATDFLVWIVAVAELHNLGLVVLDKGACYLTNAGIEYCKQHDSEILAEKDYYNNFANDVFDK